MGDADAVQQIEYAAEAVRQMYNRCTEETIMRLTAGALQSYAVVLENHYRHFIGQHQSALRTVGLRPDLAAMQIDIELLYIELGNRFTERLREIAPQLEAMPQSNNGTPVTEPARPQVSVDTNRLGQFDGRAGDWQEFRERFTQMVHANDDIPPADKFRYLVSALTGHAAARSAQWQVTEENYADAWEQLCAFYDSTYDQIMTHLDELIDMAMTDETEVARLERMADHVQYINEQIAEMADQRLDAWSAMIVFSARRAMGSAIAQIYGSRNSTQSAQTLLAFLRSYQAELAAQPNATRPAVHHRYREPRTQTRSGAAEPPKQNNSGPATVANMEGFDKKRGEQTHLLEKPCKPQLAWENKKTAGNEAQKLGYGNRVGPLAHGRGPTSVVPKVASTPPCAHCNLRNHETHHCLFHFGRVPAASPPVQVRPRIGRLPRPSLQELRQFKCGNCQLSHLTVDCRFFAEEKLRVRRARIRDRKLCSNFLNSGHTPEQCWEGPCKRCGPGQYHHELLCSRPPSRPNKPIGGERKTNKPPPDGSSPCRFES